MFPGLDESGGVNSSLWFCFFALQDCGQPRKRATKKTEHCLDCLGYLFFDLFPVIWYSLLGFQARQLGVTPPRKDSGVRFQSESFVIKGFPIVDILTTRRGMAKSRFSGQFSEQHTSPLQKRTSGQLLKDH